MSSPTLPTTMERGQWAEDLAAQRLATDGLQPVQRNYRCRWGEIDLIMRDQQTLVFVEVRFRSRGDYGSGADSVDTRKQQKLIATAEHYLQTHSKLQHVPCRFDVISVSPKEVRWIKDAFYA